jgi:hypothetical protein
MKTNLFTILILAFMGCTKQQPATTNNYVTSPATAASTASTASTTSTTTTTCTTTNGVNNCTTTTTGGAVAPSGCDGVTTANATKCYWKNIPTIQVSGGVYGQRFWISTGLPASISQNQFITDARFNVRIIPRTSTSGTSTFGRTCSSQHNTTQLKVKLQLQKQGISPGEEATLTSAIDVPSSVWHFTAPYGTALPYVLEVVNVESDAACSASYRWPTSTCPRQIPINTNTLNPTECAAFDIQFATDETYDLPGVSAN